MPGDCQKTALGTDRMLGVFLKLKEQHETAFPEF